MVKTVCWEGEKWIRGEQGIEKKRIENFEDLIVWQKGVELVKQIYLLTSVGFIDQSLYDHLRSAVLELSRYLSNQIPIIARGGLVGTYPRSFLFLSPYPFILLSLSLFPLLCFSLSSLFPSALPSCLRNLKKASHSHATTDTHGDNDMLDSSTFAFDERMADHPRAAHTVRVADRNRTAINVEPLHRNP